MEIDLVYMWVDGADPVWRAKKARYAGEQVAEQQRADVAGDCRFVENDELRYSLRSAERFAPWIRRIYVVTDGQTPAWLDTSHPRVRIVDHREILPADALPIFNSSAIEWALPRIPGLADRFLLANDDTFFGAPVGPEFFFARDGYPYLRLKHKRVRTTTSTPTAATNSSPARSSSAMRPKRRCVRVSGASKTSIAPWWVISHWRGGMPICAV